jgi:gamma-glutamyltranspeptidase/glutathione hydrolase
MKTISTVLVFLIIVCGPKTAFAQPDVHTVAARHGMVASDSSLASRIGRDVLAQGGNAVDAAVATAFGLAVTWPEAGNIGGGGFMVIRPASGPPVCIDYREVAPLAAKVNTYSKKDTTYNRKSVGVPSTVRGLELAHKKYGKLPWSDLVLPAARLAESGFTVDQPLANSTNYVLGKTAGNDLYTELHRVYGNPGGGKWNAGDVMKLPDLAKTLRVIAKEGADGFYKGEIADLLIEDMKNGDGLIVQADLDAYQAKAREAIVGSFNGYTIIGAAPPSSGGICIVQALNMVEALKIPKERYSAKTIHLLAEVSRRIFLDRARYLGDPDFVTIPDHLTKKSYAEKLAAGIDPEKATDSAVLGSDIKLADESPSTTHFSVVDGDGMAVSNTYTLEASWGSRMVVPGAGYVLNNEMGDFNWFKGLSNRQGRLGTNANLIEPGKRMLSSQCPVIVAKDGRVVMVTGSPGGRTIINTVFNVVVNHTYFGMSPTQSVRSPRFHHQWFPDRIQLEGMTKAPVSDAVNELKNMGHTVVNRGSQGSAHTIFVDSKQQTYIGIADARRDGRAAGFDRSRLACWDFGEVRGTEMMAANSDGSQKLKWNQNIVGTRVDGEEHLTIRRDAPFKPSESFAAIDQNDPPVSLSAIIKLDGVSFAGDTRNEQIRLGFTNDSTTPQVTARVVLGRTKDNQIVVLGEAMGPGATTINPVVVSESNRLLEPITLRVDMNSNSNRYWVWMKRASKMEYEPVGSGNISKNRIGRFLRLSTIGDMSAGGEFAKIDRIEVLEN